MNYLKSLKLRNKKYKFDSYLCILQDVGVIEWHAR